MRRMLDKIWYINERNKLSATLTFSAEMSHLSKAKIPFAQMLQIRNHLQDELYLQMYGHMPQTCRTIIKHIKRCEKEMREKGENLLANKLGSSAALVESLLEQITVPRPKSDPSVAHDDELLNILELDQALKDE
jgi:hypothetical protein